MNKQTPAPWGYTYDGSGTYSIGPAADPQGAAIAVIYDHDDERAKANARLIAAAPEMLAALRRAVVALAGCMGAGNEYVADEYEIVSAAIAKAVTRAA